MKQAIFILILAALMLQLSACASVFNKDYISVKDIVDTPKEIEADKFMQANNYLELKLAITRLITEHAEGGSIDLRTYSGDINRDIAAACREVSTNSLLGAYSVDYISYDLDRIVAYYDATIFISYKKTAEEVSDIISVATAGGVKEELSRALLGLTPHVVIMANNSALDERGIEKLIKEQYLKEPLILIKQPKADITVYSGSGNSRIYEMTFDYGGAAAKIIGMQKTLAEKAKKAASEVLALEDRARAQGLLNYLISACAYEKDGPKTAWSALIDGKADSEGIALAFKALCDEAMLECVVVEGRYNKQQHYWNIVKIGGTYVHADIARVAEKGAGPFLVPDTAMRNEYWWDYQDYPTSDSK